MELACIFRNQMEWLLQRVIRVDVYRSIEAVINLAPVMSVIEITPIVCRSPFVEEALARRDRPLRQTRHTVRPRSVKLLDP